MEAAEARQTACDELFTNEEEEYSLYEAMKFLMLARAIQLYDDKEKGKEVPFFSVLLFARDTSNDPEQLLRNHLNQVGHTGGLEQVSGVYCAGLECTSVPEHLHGMDEALPLIPASPKEEKEKQLPHFTFIPTALYHFSMSS